MLPSEAHLLAAGWPKNRTDDQGNQVQVAGSKPARLLHMVRRAERNLMSYERTGGAGFLCLRCCCSPVVHCGTLPSFALSSLGDNGLSA